MREKIIELLREVQYLGGLEEKIADHLIANGVTIQEWIPVTEPPKEFRNEYGELIEAAPHAQMTVTLKLENPVNEYSIIRMKNKNYTEEK